MTSAINVLNPTAGTATTASVRANFQAAKNNPGEFQIFSDASSTMKVNGWYFRVNKFIA